jgi:plasmid maintenance system killer protein
MAASHVSLEDDESINSVCACPVSIRVSANYWITFDWSRENALEVDFEDSH